MYTAILIVFSLLSTALMAQGTDNKLSSELEALHAKWFAAFDGGDGAAMDQMEMDNLVLVMPVGFIWSKTEARAGTQQKLDPQIKRTLSDVSVRRFGDAAILTGVLTSTSPKENEGGDDGYIRAKLRQVEDCVRAMDDCLARQVANFCVTGFNVVRLSDSPHFRRPVW
jgi:ketosteroid isomerase-like protein